MGTPFVCKSNDVSVAVGQAFAKAKEEQELRAGNPFVPLSSEREGSLLTSCSAQISDALLMSTVSLDKYAFPKLVEQKTCTSRLFHSIFCC